MGTRFHPLEHNLHGRKRWIVSVPVHGTVWLDAGAVRAVRDKHKSLFSAGAPLALLFRDAGPWCCAVLCAAACSVALSASLSLEIDWPKAA